MIDLISMNKAAIASLCRRFSVQRLDVFGSATSGAFDFNRSDVDFLVEFAEADQPGILRRYMELAEALEAILRVPVDLVTTQSIKNPYFKASVERTREPVYAA